MYDMYIYMIFIYIHMYLQALWIPHSMFNQN